MKIRRFLLDQNALALAAFFAILIVSKPAFAGKKREASRSSQDRCSDDSKCTREDSLSSANGPHFNQVAQKLIDLVKDVEKEGKYMRFRNLNHYCEILGPEFEETLQGLQKNQHWLDSGAGAGLAGATYFGPPACPGDFRQDKSLESKAAVSLVSLDFVEVPGIRGRIWGNAGSFQSLVELGKVQLFEGRPIEEIPNDELIAKFGPVNIITDVWGAIVYTPYLSQVLQKYYDILADGGKVFIKVRSSESEHTSLGLFSHLVHLADNTVDLVTWIESLPHFKTTRLQFTRSDSFCTTQEYSLMLTKRITGEKIPFLKLEEVVSDLNQAPFPRVFRQVQD